MGAFATEKAFKTYHIFSITRINRQTDRKWRHGLKRGIGDDYRETNKTRFAFMGAEKLSAVKHVDVGVFEVTVQPAMKH